VTSRVGGRPASIPIGVVRTLNADSELAKIGAAGLAYGDQQKATDSYIDWINAHGGVAGHLLRPAFFNYDFSTSNRPGEDQAACTALTEDHHVFVAVGLLSEIDPVMVNCFQRHDTPFIYASTEPLSTATLDHYPGLDYTPAFPDLQRAARMLADGLAAGQAFTPASKVGILRLDLPDYVDVTAHVLRPELARLGVDVVDEEGYDNSNGQEQDVGNAVLKFRAAGANTILFLSDANAPFYFVAAATSQGYFPRYGFSSSNAPELLAENYPAQALQGATVVGFNRYEDVDGGGTPTPAAQQRCASIFTADGGTYPSGISYITINAWCDSFFFFRAIASEAVVSGTLSSASMLAAKNRLATSFPVSSAYLSRFEAHRIDGLGGYQLLRYAAGCTCFARVGSPTSLREASLPGLTTRPHYPSRWSSRKRAARSRASLAAGGSRWWDWPPSSSS
jgi:ABC-type branched-subunit amino acid transport system substrate-binding protein